METRLSLGEDCLDDDECLSRVCSQLHCAAPPPTIDAQITLVDTVGDATSDGPPDTTDAGTEAGSDAVAEAAGQTSAESSVDVDLDSGVPGD